MPRAANQLIASLLNEMKAGRYPEHAELIDRIVAELRRDGRFNRWSRQMLTDLIAAIRQPKE